MAKSQKTSATKTAAKKPAAPKVKTVRRTLKKATETAELAKRAGAVEVIETAPIAVVEIAPVTEEMLEPTAAQLLAALVEGVEPGQVTPVKASHLEAAFRSLAGVLVEEKTKQPTVDHVAMQGSKGSRRKQRREHAKQLVIVEKCGKAAGRPVRNEYHAAHRARYWGEVRKPRFVAPSPFAILAASAIMGDPAMKRHVKPALAVPEMDEGDGDGKNTFHLPTPNPKRKQKGGKAKAARREEKWFDFKAAAAGDQKESAGKPCVIVSGCKILSKYPWKNFHYGNGMERADGKDACRIHGPLLSKISNSSLDSSTRARMVDDLLDRGQEPDPDLLASAQPAKRQVRVPAHAVVTVKTSAVTAFIAAGMVLNAAPSHNGHGQKSGNVPCMICGENNAPAGPRWTWKVEVHEELKAFVADTKNSGRVCQGCGPSFFAMSKKPVADQPAALAGMIAAKATPGKRPSATTPAMAQAVAKEDFPGYVIARRQAVNADASTAPEAEKDLCPLCQLRVAPAPGKLCDECHKAPDDGQKIGVKCTECGGVATHYKHFVQKHRGAQKPIWCDGCRDKKFSRHDGSTSRPDPFLDQYLARVKGEKHTEPVAKPLKVATTRRDPLEIFTTVDLPLRGATTLAEVQQLLKESRELGAA